METLLLWLSSIRLGDPLDVLMIFQTGCRDLTFVKFPEVGKEGNVTKMHMPMKIDK